MAIVPDASPAVKTALTLRAERAREEAAIHAATCRARRQGLCCSTCSELDWRASYRARLAGAAGCQVCGEPHGVSVPCGYRREDR